MAVLELILLIAAVVCWLVATFNVSSRLNLIAAGLVCVGVVLVIDAASALA